MTSPDGPDTALARALLASGALDAAGLRRALDGVRAARGVPGAPGLATWLLSRGVVGPDALASASAAVAEPPARPPPLAERVGPYRVVRRLGQGGMGAVHEVEHAETGGRYALKTLAAELADDDARERFRREAEALGRLHHPNVVAIHAAVLDGPTPYVVQELVPGGSLADRLREQGALPVGEAVALAAALAHGLAHAHAAGVLHRDLKPANVLLAERGPCLADFGLARLAGGESLTRTGEALGTPAYMSPEQVADPGGVGPAADVYGLGATLYALLTGREPFQGASVWNVLDKVLRAPPPSPRALRPDVPRALDALVQECLAKAPADRPPSAAALAERLEALRRPFAGTPQASRRRRRVELLAGGLLAAALVGGGLARRGPSPGPRRELPRPASAAPTGSAAVTPATSHGPAAAPPTSSGRHGLTVVDRGALGEFAEVECAWLARLGPEGLRARGSHERQTGPGVSFAAPDGPLEVVGELDLLLLDEPLSLDLLLVGDSVDGHGMQLGFGARFATRQGRSTGLPRLRGELVTYAFSTETRRETRWTERRCGARCTLRLTYDPASRRVETWWTVGGVPLGHEGMVHDPPPGPRWRLVTRVGGPSDSPSSPLPVCDVVWRTLVVRGAAPLRALPDEPLAADARVLEGRAPPGWPDVDGLPLDRRGAVLRIGGAVAADAGQLEASTRLFRRLWEGLRSPREELTPGLLAELGLYSPAARRALALAWLDYWTDVDPKLRRDDEHLVGVGRRDDAPARRSSVEPGHVLFHLAAASDGARALAPLAYARALAERGDPAEAWVTLARAREAVVSVVDPEGLAFDVAYRLDRFADAAAAPLPAKPTEEQLLRQARARSLLGR